MRKKANTAKNPMASKSMRFTQAVYSDFKSTSMFLVGISGLLLILFIALQPRLLATFSHRRQLTHFLNQVIENRQVNPKEYWQFRDTYSRGSMSFNQDIVQFGETQTIRSLPATKSALLQYDSPKLISTDFIVKLDPEPSIAIQMSRIMAQNASTIATTPFFEDSTTRMYEENDNQIKLVFVKTIDEMRTANGFFDFIKPEQELLQNTVWLNITTIKR